MDRLLDLTRQAEANHFWYHGFRQYVVPVMADVARGRTDLRILDCGCGTGHNLDVFARFGHTVGMDMSDGGLALARDTGRPLLKADAAHLPFPSASFDVVTSFDMMQCMEADEEAVREMARVLKPGGALVLSMAALEVLHGDHSEVWQEFRRYTRTTARRLVEQAGLRPVRVSYMFGTLFPLMLVTRTWQRLLRPYRDVRDDRDITVPAAPVNATLTAIVKGEARLSRHVEMPFGSSLLVVARKA